MNNRIEQNQSQESSLHWNAKVVYYLAVLAFLIASCTPAQATETVSQRGGAVDIQSTPTQIFTPEPATIQVTETIPTLETFESTDQIIESFKVGNVDLTKSIVATIPSAIWELLVKNKSGVDKTGDHELLVTEPHLILGSDWADPANDTAENAFEQNEYIALNPINPLEQWHVSILMDTNVVGHNVSINHAYWKKSFGEIGFYAGSADKETQDALIGQTFPIHNTENPNDSIEATFLAITTIPEDQYESWTTGPAGNIQADLYGMGIPQEILDQQDSNIIHIITCLPMPGTEYSATNPSANSLYRAIISLKLTDPASP